MPKRRVEPLPFRIGDVVKTSWDKQEGIVDGVSICQGKGLDALEYSVSGTAWHNHASLVLVHPATLETVCQAVNESEENAEEDEDDEDFDEN